MPRYQPTEAERRRGLVVGLWGEPSPGPPELALATAVARGLAKPELDLAMVVASWVGFPDRSRYAPEIAGSLEALEKTGRPAPEHAFGPGLAASLICLPLVLRSYSSNVNVVSGAYHVARLLDPHPVGQWASVAVSVVTACFLQGRSDFAADLIEVLRANEAPPALLTMARGVPVRRVVGLEDRTTNGIEDQLGDVLSVVYRTTNRAAASRGMAGRGPILQRIGEAMLGARDGDGATPIPKELEEMLDQLEST
jgi:hypothetical protein